MGTLYKESEICLPETYPLKGPNSPSVIQRKDKFQNDPLNDEHDNLTF